MKVMLDRDIAELYGIPTKALKQAVRRNTSRFPDDFMFQLSQEEFSNWRSQFVTSKQDRMGLRYSPMVFTEQAVQVNIAIMRTFVQLRNLMDNNRDLAQKIDSLEMKYDEQFAIVFEAIKKLVTREAAPKKIKRRTAGFYP